MSITTLLQKAEGAAKPAADKPAGDAVAKPEDAEAGDASKDCGIGKEEPAKTGAAKAEEAPKMPAKPTILLRGRRESSESSLMVFFCSHVTGQAAPANHHEPVMSSAAVSARPLAAHCRF